MTTALQTPVHTTVVGVFDEHARARAAFEELRASGFPDEKLSFLGPAPGTPRDATSVTNAAEGATIGAGVGAIAGGTAGLAIAAAMLTPIGPAVVGGAIMAWLAVAGTGAATGAAIGALIGLGIPEPEARWYEAELQAGRTLVLVHDADTRAEEAREILRHRGANVQGPSDIGTYGTGLPATPF